MTVRHEIEQALREMKIGDMDDGFNGPERVPAEFMLMYQPGHTDGHNRFYSGPLYESADAANFASKKSYDAYAVEAKAVSCVRIGDRVYIVDGPYKTFKDIEMEEEIRKSAMSKLTAAEKRVLGLSG